MSSQAENSKTGWPFPEPSSQPTNTTTAPVKVDPAEKELAAENIAHDKKVTKAIDSK